MTAQEKLKETDSQIKTLNKDLAIITEQLKCSSKDNAEIITKLFDNDLVLRNEIVELKLQSNTLAILLIKRNIFTQEEMNLKLQSIDLICNKDIMTN